MESGIQSSFIPHDAAVPKNTPRLPGRSGLSELTLLFSFVLLVASGALAGAVFLYAQYADTSAASKLEQLKRAEDAFEPSLIQELTRLDDRMRAGEQILANHTAPTALFDALQQTTLTTVSFRSLDLEAPDPQHITIKMSGVAESVNSIALQADLMSKSGVVTSPIFSDITRESDGVHFSLSALINPAALNYTHLLGAAQAAAAGATSAQDIIFGGSGAQTGAPAATTSQGTAATGTPQLPEAPPAAQ